MEHLLLSGCRPEQTSVDATRFQESFYGVMTYNFAKATLKGLEQGEFG